MIEVVIEWNINTSVIQITFFLKENSNKLFEQTIFQIATWSFIYEGEGLIMIEQ